MEMDRVMRLPEVCETIGFSTGHVYRMISQKRFPAPYRTGIRSVGWKQSEIQNWIDDLRKQHNKVAR